MIDTSYTRKHLKVNQIWYPRETSIKAILKEYRKVDIIFAHGVDERETKGYFRAHQIFHTCMNDLTQSEEDMLANINKAVKYQFRRSEKDDIRIEFYTKEDIKANPDLLYTFKDIYERMYTAKGSDTKLNITAIEQYLKVDGIIFSAVWHGEEMIIFHSYVYDDQDARLLHSASFFRDENADHALIGRANKRLHWEDIKYFKQKGLLRYDWGGISDFENPNGIDEFKLKFGGEKVTYYNVFAGNSIKGKCAVLGMKILHKAD